MPYKQGVIKMDASSLHLSIPALSLLQSEANDTLIECYIYITAKTKYFLKYSHKAVTICKSSKMPNSFTTQ